MNNVQYEIQKAIENDPKRLGEVWQLTNEGKSAAEIAEKWGSKIQGYIVSRQKFIQYILGGEPPTSPSDARKYGSRLRGFIKRHCDSLSAEAIQELERRAEECDRQGR